MISVMVLFAYLTFLPVGRRHLAGLCLGDGPAAEGLVLVAHQGPPEESPAGEARGGGVETVAELESRSFNLLDSWGDFQRIDIGLSCHKYKSQGSIS